MNPGNSIGRQTPTDDESSLEAMEAEAAHWLAQREGRTFTPEEQAVFEAWRAQDPRREAAFKEVEAAWKTFNRLKYYPRPADEPADPNFFARPKRFRRVVPIAVAAAAAMALVAFVWTRVPGTATPDDRTAVGAQMEGSRIVLLSDGSEVELKAGSEIVEQFGPEMRRIKLMRGEAHFAVVKNPNRPFVVEANGVAVRAIGTAFNVRLNAQAVEVLVTEGFVEVKPPVSSSSPKTESSLAGGSLAEPHASPVRTPTMLNARQRLIVPMISAPVPSVETLTLSAIDEILAWQTSRLVFEATPLTEVVARFNRHAAVLRKKPLVLNSRELASLEISGRFRADNVEAFVELLEASFGVTAEYRSEGILLRKSR